MWCLRHSSWEKYMWLGWIKWTSSWLYCWFDIIFILFEVCLLRIYYQMFNINLASLRFLLFFIFLIWKRRRWIQYDWLSKSSYKIVIHAFYCIWYVSYYQLTTGLVGNNLWLLLLSQLYYIYLFRFQIKKMKNSKKRSDARLILNIW